MWVRKSTHLELQKNGAFVRAKLFTGKTDPLLYKTFLNKIDSENTNTDYTYYEYNITNLVNVRPYPDINGWRCEFICDKKRYTLLMYFSMRKQLKNTPSQTEDELEEIFTSWKK